MKLYLIDGYGFVFRAYHSLPSLTRSDGFPIGCVYGFTNMLHKLLSKHDADYIAVVLDSGSKTFRHQLYDLYKANRPEVDPQLIMQFPLVRQVVEAFNVKVLETPGLEADDIIAAYAIDAQKQGYEVQIISSDKDLMQLITPQICMYDPLRNIVIDAQKVQEKFGVPPEQMCDYLALIGDSSDNIPGVAGIGPKTAVELLQNFATLDDIYARISEISKERTKKLLLDNKENAYLSKQLIDLRRENNIAVDIASLRAMAIDEQKLLEFLRINEFKTLLNRFKTPSSPSPVLSPSTVQYTEIIEIKEINIILNQANEEGILALTYDEQYLYAAFAKQHYKIAYNNQQQTSLFEPDQLLSFIELLTSLKAIWEDTSVLKVLIDAKLWYKLLKQQNITLAACEDIAIMSYALETGKHKCTFEDLVKAYIPLEQSTYAAAMLQIYRILQQELLRNKAISIYENIEKPMIPILAEMEILGVKLDVIFLKSLTDEFSAIMHTLERKIFTSAGREFLLSSPKQLSEVLFGDLKLPAVGKQSKTGAYATDVTVLEKLSEAGHDIADDILQWRQFSKLITTYTNALPLLINPQTGRVHSTFEMTTTNTGRLSSRHPNLQNIPIRQPEGQRIRHAFIAEPGKVIVSADYSQIELRLLAHIAQIKPLQQAFAQGDDIHAITASQIFGVPVTAVDGQLRRKAKTINFGIIYGISAFGLAKRLDISNYQAKEYIELYFKQYPGIQRYMEETIHFAREHGFVQTIFGRRCYINSINDKNFAMRGFAERAAINAPLQGSSADIIKKAMSALPIEIQKTMTLQIHDELLFEVPTDQVDEYIKKIKQAMENVSSIPLVVDVTYGKSWGEC